MTELLIVSFAIGAVFGAGLMTLINYVVIILEKKNDDESS